MDLLVVLLILAVGIGFLYVRSNQRKQRAEQEAVDKVRTVAEEDVTRLGEDVALLDAETAGRELDEPTRQDYRRALDAYDSAKQALTQVRRPEDVREVTATLEDGRYALASVRARLAGEPLPARRPPCFFNPQHGPSSEDVDWSPPGGVPRQVPACAADGERVRAGAEPDIRKVAVGAGRRPYWEAGPAYGPWAGGYFSPYAGSGLLPGVLMGALIGSSFGGWDSGSDGSDGSGDGGDGGDSGDSGDSGDGGGDGGGYEAGGDYGGGDYGGGDYGGGGFDGGGFDGGGFDGGF